MIADDIRDKLREIRDTLQAQTLRLDAIAAQLQKTNRRVYRLESDTRMRLALIGMVAAGWLFWACTVVR